MKDFWKDMFWDLKCTGEEWVAESWGRNIRDYFSDIEDYLAD